jgi:hypothetical protein
VAVLAACRHAPAEDPKDQPPPAQVDEAPPAAPSAGLASLLPDGVDIIGMADVDALRGKGALDAVLGLDDDQQPSALIAMRQALGIDPVADVDRAAFGLAEDDPAAGRGLVALRCKYDRHVVEAAAGGEGLALRAGDVPAGTLPVVYTDGGRALALLTSDTLLYGDEQLVDAALAHAAGKGPGALDDPALAQLWRVATVNVPDVAVAARTTSALRARMADAGLPDDVATVLFALALSKEGDVRAAVLLGTASKASAEKDASDLRMALAEAGDEPLLTQIGLGDSLLAAPVIVEKSGVRLDLQIAGSTLRRALARLRAGYAIVGAAAAQSASQPVSQPMSPPVSSPVSGSGH